MKQVAAPADAAVRAPITIVDGKNPLDGADMVFIPAGEFLMGSPAGTAGADETPQHKVYLDGYWIYRTEVTVAQYRKFCAATGATDDKRSRFTARKGRRSRL